MKGLIGQIAGIPLYESIYAVNLKQVKFPRCKSKRILKKFKKCDSNFKRTPSMYRGPQGIICHPSLIPRIESHLKRVIHELEK